METYLNLSQETLLHTTLQLCDETMCNGEVDEPAARRSGDSAVNAEKKTVALARGPQFPPL